MHNFVTAFPEKLREDKEGEPRHPLTPSAYTLLTTRYQMGTFSGPSYDLNEAHHTNIVWCHLLFYISRNLASFEIL